MAICQIFGGGFGFVRKSTKKTCRSLWILYFLIVDEERNNWVKKPATLDSSELVGLVTSWVSSNNHSSFLYVSLGLVRLEPPAGARNRRKATVII